MDKDENQVKLNKEKIIVLDFWSTNCSICFEKFPDLEEIYQKYKTEKNIEIYTVNVPVGRDKFHRTIKILDSIGYKFPKLYTRSMKEIEDSLHFNKFPHLIIIKNNRIRYDGVLVTEKYRRIYNIESEINRLLKE
ncbi:MAG: redoxin domain-containing protein [Flavobacterium sp.]|nr:redoxin domain-containing protein [Flavobacterium sp.]